MSPQQLFRLPVVSVGAEHLVMGYLMRRNILTCKAPQNNEGHNLNCIHLDPQYTPKRGEAAQFSTTIYRAQERS